MKKQPSKKPAPKAPMMRRSEPDPARVAFLYSDLGLDQRTIARLLKSSIGAVERVVKARALVRHQPLHGAWSEALVREFATWLGLTLPALAQVDPEDVWTKLRVALRNAIVKKLERDPNAVFLLDRFLRDLPHRQRAAEERLTRERLGFLHGDLGMQAPEIARLLEASWSAVRTVLDREKLHRNDSAQQGLNEELLTTLARTLGCEEWPIERASSDGYFRDDRQWSAVRGGTARGLLRLAAEHRLDLAVLDRFIAMIPKLVAERRARLLSKTPAKRTVAPTKKAA